ncbi:hypothetical protein AK812_SmicGene31112 [Symbiodinium microadriaticum]|uniref:Uncharacterized protein n=1 Tax=Symbiodinium microadriaticum TaxID=2951 RepID=A0A1Q9CXJ9_SYMMI|nr:hypothetical protein AK812_SmicGene31112 [Symbiodinium microadriaticum]CAE7874480.1 unnamed protein product [Symbiodinium microadriaticum]
MWARPSHAVRLQSQDVATLLQGAQRVRWFAKRRRRLDQYENFEKPLSAKAWTRLTKDGGFFEHSFQDMTPGEVSDTVFSASKMGVEATAFWTRASLSTGDLASAMTARQLATACYAFGAVKWHDEDMVRSIAPSVIKQAPSMKPALLAAVVQSFARMKVRNMPALRAISQAVQISSRFNGKGLSMVAKSFAELEFRCPDFLQALDAWAAGGVDSSTLEACLDLLQSLAAFSALEGPLSWPSPTPFGQAVPALAPVAVREILEMLGRRVKELEPPQLHTAILAMGKLRVQDLVVLEAFQKEILADLSRMHTNSLPPVLESFALCYEQLRSSGQDSEDSSVHEEREVFLVQLTSRMARELRLLRPQDASRVLSAIGRLGLVDPKLLSTAAALVPPRLAAYSSPEVLALLEAYAAAGNRDSFMLPCLRKALVPLPHALEDRLQELDDAQIVQAASAFALLGHAPGLVALLAVLREPFQRRSAGHGARRRAAATADSGIEQTARHLTPACQLALATLVSLHLSDSQTWAAAASAVMQGAAKEASKHQDGASDSLLEKLKQSLEIAEDPWRSAGKVSLYSGDELVLACLGFPRHSGRAFWYEEVSGSKMAEVSLSLLPGFLRHAAEAELGETRRAPLPSLRSLRPTSRESSELSKARGRAQEVLLERLTETEQGQEELQELPPMVIVALFRALELINSGPFSVQPEAQDLQVVHRATVPLLQRLAMLAQEQQLSAKACVRILQSMKVARYRHLQNHGATGMVERMYDSLRMAEWE